MERRSRQMKNEVQMKESYDCNTLAYARYIFRYYFFRIYAWPKLIKKFLKSCLWTATSSDGRIQTKSNFDYCFFCFLFYQSLLNRDVIPWRALFF